MYKIAISRNLISKKFITKWILIFSISYSVGACSNSVLVKEKSVASPDKIWIAHSELRQYSGPGNNIVIVTVSLINNNNKKRRINVLVLEQNSNLTPKIRELWKDSKHLLLFYRNGQIDFQAIQASGVEISTHQMS